MLERPIHLILVLVALSFGPDCVGQSFTNPNFESGSSGWTDCPLEINPESVYGGSGSNMVAEVDGHNDANSTADDRRLCQTLTGLTPGAVYLLEFDATRRQGGSTPATVSVTVTVDDALSVVVTRTGGWNMVHESHTFAASTSSHTMQIAPDFTESYGMLFDNFNISVASPLPVQLLHFDAQALEAGVQLDWATGSEQNSAGFGVERSEDLESWAQVAYLSGAGNSQHTIAYQAVDDRPVHGTSYYRLRQIDTDGREELSTIKHVYVQPFGQALSVWPNPAVGRLYLRMADPGPVEVLNALGQRMAVVQRQGLNGVELGIAHLPRGHYMVRCGTTAERSAHFIKE